MYLEMDVDADPRGDDHWMGLAVIYDPTDDLDVGAVLDCIAHRAEQRDNGPER